LPPGRDHLAAIIQEERGKPLDASDLTGLGEAKAEVVRLRSLLKQLDPVPLLGGNLLFMAPRHSDGGGEEDWSDLWTDPSVALRRLKVRLSSSKSTPLAPFRRGLSACLSSCLSRG
jgi:hypothetical protein